MFPLIKSLGTDGCLMRVSVGRTLSLNSPGHLYLGKETKMVAQILVRSIISFQRTYGMSLLGAAQKKSFWLV